MLEDNPLFIDINNLNYEYSEDSPCIDSGNPDLFDPDNTTSDIGAIFYNQETECSLLGDINNDNQVNILDVVETVNFILFESVFDSLNCSDINYDGVINIIDIVLMVNIILDI